MSDAVTPLPASERPRELAAAAIPTTPVYVISLQRADQRRAAFERRFVNSSMPWSYVDACRGLVPGLVYDETDAILAKGRPLHPSELGCYASHYSIWQGMVASNVAQAIILEDDVIVDWKMMERLAAIDFDALDVHYLRLYGKSPCAIRPIWTNFLGDSHALIEMRGLVFGTQGYLVTRRGATRLLEWCRKVRRPIDDEMDRTWAHGLPNLALFPFPIIEETIVSSIGRARYDPFVVPEKLQLRRLLASMGEKALKAIQPVTRYGYAKLGPNGPMHL